MEDDKPKIAGYRVLTAEEIALINEAKALAEQCGAFVEKLRSFPATIFEPKMHTNIDENGVAEHKPSIDQRWVSIGATNLQHGFMDLVRSIAQPTTF